MRRVGAKGGAAQITRVTATLNYWRPGGFWPMPSAADCELTAAARARFKIGDECRPTAPRSETNFRARPPDAGVSLSEEEAKRLRKSQTPCWGDIKDYHAQPSLEEETSDVEIHPPNRWLRRS